MIQTQFYNSSLSLPSKDNNQTINLYLNKSNINNGDIFFLPPVNNKIVPGLFSRIIYSHPLFSTNGIYCDFYLNTINAGIFYNKITYKFNPNQEAVFFLKQLERKILEEYILSTNSQKTQTFKLQDVLNSGVFKIFLENQSNYNSKYVECVQKKTHLGIKIIGVWESYTECGIIYKCFTIEN